MMTAIEFRRMALSFPSFGACADEGPDATFNE